MTSTNWRQILDVNQTVISELSRLFQTIHSNGYDIQLQRDVDRIKGIAERLYFAVNRNPALSEEYVELTKALYHKLVEFSNLNENCDFISVKQKVVEITDLVFEMALKENDINQQNI